jgi:hypothetical protein
VSPRPGVLLALGAPVDEGGNLPVDVGIGGVTITPAGDLVVALELDDGRVVLRWPAHSVAPAVQRLIPGREEAA